MCRVYIEPWPSGKAQDFDSCIHRFESYRLCQLNGAIAQWQYAMVSKTIKCGFKSHLHYQKCLQFFVFHIIRSFYGFLSFLLFFFCKYYLQITQGAANGFKFATIRLIYSSVQSDILKDMYSKL